MDSSQHPNRLLMQARFKNLCARGTVLEKFDSGKEVVYRNIVFKFGSRTCPGMLL